MDTNEAEAARSPVEVLGEWLRHRDDRLGIEPERACFLMPSVRPDNPNCTCGLADAVARLAEARPVAGGLSGEEAAAFAQAERLIAEGSRDDRALYVALENVVCMVERLSSSPPVGERRWVVREGDTITLEDEPWLVTFYDAEGDDLGVELHLRLIPATTP
jgi:hypothetical protein